jgi:hypothetical protein
LIASVVVAVSVGIVIFLLIKNPKLAHKGGKVAGQIVAGWLKKAG